MHPQDSIPAGLCQCGCGQSTRRAVQNGDGYRIGEFKKYLKGHAAKAQMRPKPVIICACGCGGIVTSGKGQHIKGHGSRTRSGKHRMREIGETKISEAGYIQVYRPDHPHAPKNGWVMQHRLVMEESLGRYLDPREVVHHLNHNKEDNRRENLQLLTGECANCYMRNRKS